MVFNHDYENIIRWFHVGWWVRREKWFSKQKNMDNITQEPRNNHTHIHTQIKQKNLPAGFSSRSAGNMFK